jgi:diguanylate cyclase (GGDEF)-like protein
MIPASPTGVHIIDATKGPLVGAGRIRRILPFVATEGVSLAVAVPTATWEQPHLAVAGGITIAAMVVVGVAAPWARMPRRAQLAPIFVGLAATLLLMQATGQAVRSPLVALIVVPFVWFAIYEDRAAVLTAVGLTGVALCAGLASGPVEPSGDVGLSIAVLLIVSAGMGTTLHGLVADVRQVTVALREHHVALERLSLHDPLTDLANRRGFAAAGVGARNERRPFSYVYIDLDRFKELNDDFGHHVGDELLKEVAGRLRACVRATDTVARLGGDEFAVLVDGCAPSAAVLLAERIEEALTLPYVAAPGAAVSASVGIAHSVDVGPEPEAVLSAADTSMFEHKRRRRVSPAG